jgi:GTP-binding protein Era
MDPTVPDPERPDAENPEGESPTQPEFRSGYVALVGAPNAGKSTLMNRLLQERIAIVTPKPQTTRRRTLGIMNGEGFQIVLLDTPGLLTPRYDLHRAMLNEATEALATSDAVVFLTELKSPVETPAAIASMAAPRVLALNKIDLMRNKAELLPVLAAWNDTGLFRELVPISALTGEGVPELLRVLVPLLPLGPPFYPADQLADQSERFFVAEIIRERLFERYQKEVPYATEVAVEEFKERPEAKDYIEAWIFVEHPSQKAILIGKEGGAIKALGEEARAAIEAFLGRPVYLTLRVKILPGWRKNPVALRKLGYKGAPPRPRKGKTGGSPKRGDR